MSTGLGHRATIQFFCLTALTAILLGTASGSRVWIRWGRAIRQPLIRGDFSRCDWTPCVSSDFSTKAHGCVNTGEYLRGNPQQCDGGGTKYFCCKYPGEDTVGFRPRPPKKEPWGVPPSRFPPLVKLKETFLSKIEQKLNKFRNWLKVAFPTEPPWDRERDRENWRKKWDSKVFKNYNNA